MAVIMVRPRRKKGKAGKATVSGTGQFSLRPRLARLIPHGAMFEPEITEDGILYRFVGIKGKVKKAQEPTPDASWLDKGESMPEAPGERPGKLVALDDDELEAVQRIRQSRKNYAKAQG